MHPQDGSLGQRVSLDDILVGSVQAVNLAEHNVRASFWKKGVLTAYLRSCSIASSGIQSILTKYNLKKGTHNAISQAEDHDDSEVDDGFTADTMIDSCVPRMWEANPWSLMKDLASSTISETTP